MKTHHIGITLLFSIVLCMACGVAQTENAAADNRGVLVNADRIQELDKKNWRLIKMVKVDREIPLVQGSRITFSCTTEGAVSGLASINRYSGSLTISETGEIKWGERGFRMTRMVGPPELMRQEGVFINSLRKTHRMFVKNARLFLESKDGSLRLEFVKVNN